MSRPVRERAADGSEKPSHALLQHHRSRPVKPDKHYCIPPLARLDLDEVLRLVDGEKYFVLHAPRQTGKTSALLALRDLLNGQGYQCLYTTVEEARTAHDDVQRAMRAGACRTGLGCAVDAGRRRPPGQGVVRHPCRVRPGQGVGRGADALGAGVAEAADAAHRRDRHPPGRPPALDAPTATRGLPPTPGLEHNLPLPALAHHQHTGESHQLSTRSG